MSHKAHGKQKISDVNADSTRIPGDTLVFLRGLKAQALWLLLTLYASSTSALLPCLRGLPCLAATEIDGTPDGESF